MGKRSRSKEDKIVEEIVKIAEDLDIPMNLEKPKHLCTAKRAWWQTVVV